MDIFKKCDDLVAGVTKLSIIQCVLLLYELLYKYFLTEMWNVDQDCIFTVTPVPVHTYRDSCHSFVKL